MIHLNNIHTFELSGLGKAPFEIVAPKKNPFDADRGEIFWCEHCGTALKNRYFVKSSYGRVSVVGIDCLKKIGDAGLEAGVLRLKREHAQLQREAKLAQTQAERDERQRRTNGGLTNAELIQQLEEQREALCQTLHAEMLEHPIVGMLTRFGFEMSMCHIALCGETYTPGQLQPLKKIITKKLSGARKGSKSYLAHLSEASDRVDQLQARLWIKKTPSATKSTPC
ncbi:hypothetical protein [Marinobacterium stanieri]|uniref:Uncharacterized protein n=1 Tax=Marinobacterium stanieri TaxID=49186 RepID=A0A1N6XL34_9GAMM|nr:hypothetical protein [Marinobacterium stanieri]SIR02967.1 hypothetical protein SAMN05421647_11482 [Marinobacterium stanieri]